MNGQAESEQLQNLHKRLNKRVSGQGFWFQLRDSLSGKGKKGTFLRLVARLIMLLLAAAAVIGFYLMNLTSTDSFREAINGALKQKLGAEEMEMSGLENRQGQFSISRIAMAGREGTFFSGLELRNLKCRRTLLDSFRKEWDPGVISISSVNLDLRSGTDSPEAAESIAATYFQDTAGFKLNTIHVKDMSIRWGYSKHTRGSLIGSEMRAERLPNGWKLKFTGGTFSQGWLKRLQIEELRVAFDREGMVFENALFRKNEGHVSFHDLKLKASDRPEVSGIIRLRNMDISSLLPITARNYVEGTLSAELNVFGTTNSTEGVGFEGDVVLDGEDVITLRDRIHILKALTVVDAANSYRRVEFRDGSFRMKTNASRFEITGADLTAGDLFRMKGGMSVRMPTPEETLADRSISPRAVENELEDDFGITQELDDEVEITLERAAGMVDEASRQDFGMAGYESFFGKPEFSLQNHRLEELASEHLYRSLRYEGYFQISLPKDAFDRAPGLAEAYPGRDPAGRILMDVPLEGALYELSQKQADEIYEKGAR